jgi:hypothetical protein
MNDLHGKTTATRPMPPGPLLFCGDPHGQWQHIIDAAMDTNARAVILLGDLEPARPLHIELVAIWERVWFIHGNHDTGNADNFANVWHSELADRADAIAFGRPYIANPDLVQRLQLNAPLAAVNPKTIYVPGPEGYIDYPCFQTT